MKDQTGSSHNEMTRRGLLIQLGAGALALGVTSACAPIQPLASVETTKPGDLKMITEPSDKSFHQFLPQFEEGTTRFINGDPALWIEHVSQNDDATIMGGWGAYEQGWDEVGPRYDWAAARFMESGVKMEVEYLASGVSDELAYTVAIERSEALIVGQDQPAPLALRVTHLFRMEDGEWKLIHRHADPLMEKTAPDAVLQR
jgi:ketosteroid isomerase-like protein